MNFSDKLREFADYLDDRPDLLEVIGSWDYPTVYFSVDDWEDFQNIIGQLGGYEKSGYSGSLEARHQHDTEDGSHVFVVTASVHGVCERVPKVDETGAPVTHRKRVYVDTDEVEQEYEYKCPTVWSS